MPNSAKENETCAPITRTSPSSCTAKRNRDNDDHGVVTMKMKDTFHSPSTREVVKNADPS